MPNGRGALDCCNCRHFDGEGRYPDGAGEERLCAFHGVVLPATIDPGAHRICGHFEQTPRFTKDLGPWTTVARLFAWFGIDLEPGVLYEFGYNDPPGVARLAVLRRPDYEGGGWMPAE